MQTYGVLKELMAHHVHTFGLLMGGSNRSAEAQRLANGVNILVATPGRLLDHLQVSTSFGILWPHASETTSTEHALLSVYYYWCSMRSCQILRSICDFSF
jgi:hypothetical protein